MHSGPIYAFMAPKKEESRSSRGAVYLLIVSLCMSAISGYQVWRRATIDARTSSCAAVVTFDATSRIQRKDFDRFTVRCSDGATPHTGTWSGETHAIDRAAVVGSTRAYDLDGTLVPEAGLDHAMRMITCRILLACATALALLSIVVLLRSSRRRL